MFLSYFTEQPMSTYPEDEGLAAGITSVLFSNKFFDPVEGSRLYRERLAEYRLAEEVGFDGIMVNEHHNAPYCMQPRITVWSSILAAVTERVKIVQLGNPLPTYDSPLQFAEEIAMIDMISEGRLVSGIVRGAGQEQICLNANPAYNRERFDEAHDLLVKTFTEDGPFSWEGEHYQYRVVNPWARPAPEAPPPDMGPRCLQRRDARVGRPASLPLHLPEHAAASDRPAVGDLRQRGAGGAGYEPGPENRGYLLRVHVQDTEEKALECAREFMWMQGQFTGVGHPYWVSPLGLRVAGATPHVHQTGQRVDPADQRGLLRGAAGEP